MSKRARLAVKVGLWAACLFPVALLVYEFQTDRLGVNPIDHVTRTLGDWTLRLLLVSLSLTPLRLLFGISWQMSLRRLLGLFAFFYASLHFFVWIALDHFFDWEQLVADVWKRPYITVGVLGLVLLVPLAATSTRGMVKRLGGGNWRRLHRLVYVAAVLGVLHYLWLAKKGVNDPFLYAGALVVLLGIRLWDWARRGAKQRWPGVSTSEGFQLPARRTVILLILLSLGFAEGTVGPAAGQALRRGQPTPELTGVLAATQRFGVRYPVVQDNDPAIWRRFGVWAWPTMVLVNKQGILRYQHIGEGNYEETPSVIRRLLADKE